MQYDQTSSHSAAAARAVGYAPMMPEICQIGDQSPSPACAIVRPPSALHELVDEWHALLMKEYDENDDDAAVDRDTERRIEIERQIAGTAAEGREDLAAKLRLLQMITDADLTGGIPAASRTLRLWESINRDIARLI